MSFHRLKLSQVAFAFILGFSLPNWAESTKPSDKKQKSTVNTQVYEKEATDESFSAKVSVVRDVHDEVEVFFDGPKKGPYTLPDGPNQGLYMERLEKSKKASGPSVQVTIDNDRIQSVEIVQRKEQEQTGPTEEEMMKSVFKGN